MLTYEEVCQVIKKEPLLVKTDDGMSYYLISPVPNSKKFYAKIRLCKGSMEMRVYYDEIIEIL